jgi:hypothetical protein
VSMALTCLQGRCHVRGEANTTAENSYLDSYLKIVGELS